VKLKIAHISVAQRIQNLVSSVNLPTAIKDIEAEDIIAKLILDKKVRDGKVLFVLPKNIGSVVIKNDVPVKIVREALKEMGAK
jgi:3-dehydroquinate synthase